MALPRYPIYIPSKGRSEKCLTARFLSSDGVPFHLVVEPEEAEAYAKVFGHERVLKLPFSNLGLGSIPARNWIKDHATKAGHERHWQLDDNIRQMWRRIDGIKLPCQSGPAFAAVEDFSDRYENVAVAGMNYYMFAPNRQRIPPFYLNVHVYSCTLILNSIPNKWRGRYNEDTDMCLQVLADGWCTVLFNQFLAEKQQTMKMKGGNTAELYKGDGRLKMARALERVWPHVVETKRRFKRPQHVVRDAWGKFDNELKLRPGVELSKIKPNNYGMRLVKVKPEIKSSLLRRMVSENSGDEIRRRP